MELSKVAQESSKSNCGPERMMLPVVWGSAALSSSLTPLNTIDYLCPSFFSFWRQKATEHYVVMGYPQECFTAYAPHPFISQKCLTNVVTIALFLQIYPTSKPVYLGLLYPLTLNGRRKHARELLSLDTAEYSVCTFAVTKQGRIFLWCKNTSSIFHVT